MNEDDGAFLAGAPEGDDFGFDARHDTKNEISGVSANLAFLNSRTDCQNLRLAWIIVQAGGGHPTDSLLTRVECEGDLSLQPTALRVSRRNSLTGSLRHNSY